MPSADPIPSDLQCAGCSYNPRPLAMDGRCPECGMEVAASVRALWESNSSGCLRSARRACQIAQVGIVLILLASIRLADGHPR